MIHQLRRSLLRVLSAAAPAACLLGVLASPALAQEAPGWVLTARTYPTHLAMPVNEVQQVTVNATSGTFTLTFEGVETTPIPAGSPAATVQADLEALSSVGSGNVVVSGTPDHYAVAFHGALGAHKVEELQGNGSELKGGEQTVTVSVETEGATSGVIDVNVFNVGATASNGTITVTDTLPAGVVAVDAGELIRPAVDGSGTNFGVMPELGHSLWDCSGNGSSGASKVFGATTVTCTNDPGGLPQFAGGGGLPAGPLGSPANLQPPIGITVRAEAEAADLDNHVAITGGGAPSPASTDDPLTISSSPASFGLVGWDAWFSNADGTIDTQAGSHPYEATFSFDLASALGAAGQADRREGYLPGGEPRHIVVSLPAGVIGNPLAVAQCTRPQLDNESCPPTSQVGDIEVNTLSGVGIVRRVFNVVPPPGVAAELGFNFEGILVLLNASARTGGDYGINTDAENVPQRVAVQSILTIWGVPGEASHNLWRAGRPGGCTQEEIKQSGGTGENSCLEPQFASLKPFLTLPTSCGAPQPFAIKILSGWQNPGATSEASVLSHDAHGNPVGFTGCENLAFGPGLRLTPEVSTADSASGLMAEVQPPLGGLEQPGARSTANIRHVTVTLPEGMAVNPGQAAGLQACQETAEQSAIGTEEAANCPAASKIGTARIKSPLLETASEKEFEGSVYLLQSNPPQIHLLVAASADGVNLKLVGIARLNTSTGQIETTFGEDPEVEASDPFLKGHLALPDLPSSDFKLTFEGGPKAALVTPANCGSYSAPADFSSWASPFISDFSPNPMASFAITAGPGDGACPSAPLPFSPSFSAGSSNTEAGAFTAFSQQISRGDGQQRIQSFSFTEPAGLSGMISKVPLCGEAQANTGTCSSASQIGHAIVQSGPGQNPLTLPQPGGPEIPIYLTGAYRGAPYGLSIPTPIVAGPFNLGTIVTRAKIEVNPYTAQLTITTDPLPQIVDGVPTDIRSIYAVIDRQSFVFNPTNCTPAQFTGTATGTGGASAPLSSRFAVGGCRGLRFTPTIALATPAQSSKAKGAGLSVKISYPSGSVGSQSWFNEAKLTFPKQLPARLTTLQKACLAATFEANPAACPAASLIGRVTVHTPVLPVPLTGPAYFVSFGAAKFPDVVFVLQGYGVTIILRGETLIRSGITSATFKNTPDVPFENIEVSVPQGSYSEFAANLPESAKGSFCGQKMTVSTFFKAQNGLELKGSAPVSVSGCANAITLRGHSVKGRSLILTVLVPAAGKLTASGKGLSAASEKASGSQVLTLRLHAKRGGRLRTKVELSFQPSKGKRLGKSLVVGFR